MTPALREACRRALHVVTNSGRVMRAGEATLFIADELGYHQLARFLRIPPFVWAVELGYRIVAANRSFFSRFLFRRRPS